MTPSAQLAAATAAIDGIEYEVMAQRDGSALYRYTCRCGSRGCWHSHPEVAREIAAIHAQTSHGAVP